MATQATKKKARVTRDSLFTTVWGWFTAPRFGSAGSGGLEYEPLPSRTRELPVASTR